MISRDSLRWAVIIVAWTFSLSMVLSFASGQALEGVGYVPAALILLTIILLGIVADLIGLAVATASEKPFHSMSSRRVHGATQALWLLRHAEKVASVCNDMVGDITGIITGALSAVIASRVASDLSVSFIAAQLVAASLAASLTVGGKALGKSIALRHNTQIVFRLGRIMHVFSRRGKRTEKSR
ncbi:MAG: hypothetical protein FWE59_04010 [Oscillospiraceae bacterium]|nr:hypothetical protein [Oscillospiraceae bacterium]